MKYIFIFLLSLSAYSSEVTDDNLKKHSFGKYFLNEEVMNCYNSPILKRINYNPTPEYYITITTLNNENVIFLKDKKGEEFILPFSEFNKVGEYNVRINDEAYTATKAKDGKITFSKGGTLSDNLVDFKKVEINPEIMGGINHQFFSATKNLIDNPEKCKDACAEFVLNCTVLGMKYENKLLTAEIQKFSKKLDQKNKKEVISNLRRLPASHFGGEGGGGVGASASEK